ncbi:hypothetical protein [Mesobacterium pallidum]|uniref:hypothetical protein n=1 Tax=Mesobacterium pallidum TaxID=2872037 RepID=UPI001EE1D6C3|nr:hypothetical protein [Mesobacterium pallidum]
MSSKTQTAFAPSLSRPAPRRLLGRLLGWIVSRDAAYREARKLERMPKERLRDMGLDALDRTGNRPADNLPIIITGGW